ncbi:MAG: hypothetical protein JXR70_01845 [Spirochaetales bacterium]|nr:hypothetical protein [Spirochaetales bacterium]
MYYLIIAIIIIFVLVIIRKERHSNELNGIDSIDGFSLRSFFKRLSSYFDGAVKISGFDWGFPCLKGKKEGLELSVTFFNQIIQIEINFSPVLAFPCSFLYQASETSLAHSESTIGPANSSFHDFYIESDNLLFACEINTSENKKRLHDLCTNFSRLEIQAMSLEADFPVEDILFPQLSESIAKMNEILSSVLILAQSLTRAKGRFHELLSELENN